MVQNECSLQMPIEAALCQERKQREMGFSLLEVFVEYPTILPLPIFHLILGANTILQLVSDVFGNIHGVTQLDRKDPDVQSP